jgi:hypothetical protein
MRTGRVTACVIASLALSACGALGPLSFGPASAGDLTCDGGPSFPADVLEGPAGAAETGADPAAVALREHLATDHIEFDSHPDEGWIEVSRGDASVLYLAPVPEAEGSWHYVTVGREGDAWDVDGWGGCALQPDVGRGFGIASFRVAPDVELDPAAAEIPVLVTERACNSGQDARGRIVVASIEEDDERVTVTLAVRPRGGAQTCPSNPETPFVLELQEPLGGRALFDGSSVPPRDAMVCPDIAICQ